MPLFSLFLFFSLSNAPRLTLIFSRCFVVFSLFLSLLVAKPRQKAHPQRERKTRRRRISPALRSAAFTGRHVKATLKVLTLQREKRRERELGSLPLYCAKTFLPRRVYEFRRRIHLTATLPAPTALAPPHRVFLSVSLLFFLSFSSLFLEFFFGEHSFPSCFARNSPDAARFLSSDPRQERNAPLINSSRG